LILGLGFETAKELTKHGATVVIGSRSIAKGNEAKNIILKSFPNAKIEVFPLDLSSFESVQAFSISVKENFSQIDALINNAGVMAIPNREVTQEGLEVSILLPPIIHSSPM
jgi:NAD(P)-dependent dehydrogenase (short-subunit alcohol dehydrogenase family)